MVLEKVKAILAEQFDVEEEKITVDTDLQEDLGADSLDVVDLLMSIEDEFEVEVPDEEIENIKTVGALVNYIAVLSGFLSQPGLYPQSAAGRSMGLRLFRRFPDRGCPCEAAA